MSELKAEIRRLRQEVHHQGLQLDPATEVCGESNQRLPMPFIIP